MAAMASSPASAHASKEVGEKQRGLSSRYRGVEGTGAGSGDQEVLHVSPLRGVFDPK